MSNPPTYPPQPGYQPQPPPGYQPQQMRPAKSHRTRNVLFGIVGGIVLLFIGVGIGAAGNSSGSGSGSGAAAPAPTVTVTQTTTNTVTVSPSARPKPAGPATRIPAGVSGVYVVGVQIKRGTWTTSGAVGGTGGNCYEATLSSLSSNDIIDNNNVTGPDTVQIGPGVKAFQVDGCQAWRRIGS